MGTPSTEIDLQSWRRRTGYRDETNGAEGDRTLNLRIANAALSQLSYRPIWITRI